MGKVLFVFLDGVGIGEPVPDKNPFYRSELPTLRGLLGGELPHLGRPEVHGPNALAFPLDPKLGIDGLPQSGTGQTALFTGKNAPALHGRHFGPWVPVRLRPLLRAESILAQAKASGFECAFANAYPKEYPDSKWARRPAAPPLAAEAAGLLTRQAEALARGEAISSEIVNSTWRAHLGYSDLPDPTPTEAGGNLARIAIRNDLTLFAHYATDYAGHRGKMEGAVRALERVDAFVSGIVDGLTPETLLVVASDHGNLEDVDRGHTLNPVFTLFAGEKAAKHRKGLEAITDITPLLMRVLSEG